MSMVNLRHRWPRTWPLQPIPRIPWARQEPTYQEARPKLIQAALKRAEARPSGNWFVFAASRDIRSDRPCGATVAGIELVAWRDERGALLVGPGTCPHLGAPLSQARVDGGDLLCRWHGLRLGKTSDCGWRVLPSHDDGVLAWVRLDRVGGEEPLESPVITERPDLASSIDSVATLVGTCEPRDVIANRLDPWHGSWFHPYSFSRLRVLQAPDESVVDDSEDRFVVAVTFLVTPTLGVPVRAEFVCPDPRTIVMRIIDGEGAGSVVETHATPLGPGPDGKPRTAVIEAVIARSPRPGFNLARTVAPAIRPLMRRAAARLWRDDLAYAERRYELRSRP
ncbi:DUF5914 domain-containing protein [Saccharopolyspora rectivirgula]|jgi:hypothetical protein|uniref:2Fe-2S ferredoxin n=1 Tax=Saccharopolyspora rectivirgula TaxID=28042 RepID=A0A073B2M4_9PSEU|nr:DUF5914 domain-containing protein [Saccharopolyspora rectivirgula]KEI45870.1 2Fe-2S ferredoxin [Saccharopolyspora rectivirgula]